jgi:SAM-dependent methyltransferase
MGYDSYERHQAVSTLLGRKFSGAVLDVGGLSGGLRRFLPNAQVVALNLDGTGDVAYGGETIPFSDGAFDVVVSLDTLEHVPWDARTGLLSECIRVAGRALLVAAPYGTPGHSAYEAKLDRLYRDVHGDFHQWLHEHVIRGLPNDEEIAGLCQMLMGRGFSVRVYYSGDYEWQCRNFERSLNLAQRLGPFHRLRGLFDLLTIAVSSPVPTLAETASETTNRFYLFGERL